MTQIVKIFLFSFICTFSGYCLASDELPILGIDVDKTSVSGLSSGAFMSSQFYLANSDIMVGAGVIAGGPYLCAQSYAFLTYAVNATSTCLNPLTKSVGPNTPSLVKKTKTLAKENKIDSLANIKEGRIYLFSGKQDHIVSTLVVDQTEQFFLDLDMPEKAIFYNKSVNAGHAIITNNAKDTKCAETQMPYINDCDFEQPSRIMRHIYGDLNAAATKLSGELLIFNQKAFIDDKYTGMTDDAYVYVPKACYRHSCRLHVAFHGCLQSAKEFANTGYNQIADTNNLIVLYPQVARSNGDPVNPLGCWDYWGYSSPDTPTPDYFTKNAPQIKAVRLMVDHLARKANLVSNSTAQTAQ